MHNLFLSISKKKFFKKILKYLPLPHLPNPLQILHPYSLTIVDRYLFSNFFFSLISSLLLFIIIYLFSFLINDLPFFIQQMQDGNQSVTFNKIFDMYINLIPHKTLWISPLAFLFSSIYTLGTFYKYNEAVAYVAAGIHLFRFALVILISSLLYSLLLIPFTNYVVVPTYDKSKTIYLEMRNRIPKNPTQNIETFGANYIHYLIKEYDPVNKIMFYPVISKYYHSLPSQNPQNPQNPQTPQINPPTSQNTPQTPQNTPNIPQNPPQNTPYQPPKTQNPSLPIPIPIPIPKTQNPPPQKKSIASLSYHDIQDPYPYSSLSQLPTPPKTQPFQAPKPIPLDPFNDFKDLSRQFLLQKSPNPISLSQIIQTQIQLSNLPNYSKPPKTPTPPPQNPPLQNNRPTPKSSPSHTSPLNLIPLESQKKQPSKLNFYDLKKIRSIAHSNPSKIYQTFSFPHKIASKIDPSLHSNSSFSKSQKLSFPDDPQTLKHLFPKNQNQNQIAYTPKQFQISSTPYFSIPFSPYFEYRIDAEKAVWNPKTQQWIAYQVQKRSWNPKKGLVQLQYLNEFPLNVQETPDYFTIQKKPIDQISFQQGKNLISNLKQSKKKWREYYIDLYANKIAFQLSTFLITLVGITIGSFHSRKLILVNSFFKAILIFLLYFVFFQLGISIAKVWEPFPISFAPWFGNIIFLFFAFFMLRRIQT